MTDQEMWKLFMSKEHLQDVKYEAWILNYSNPAAIVAEALRREFPEDKKILNICDQPENVVRSCSRLLKCSWEDLDPVYFGLNHYGWFTHMYDVHTGEDLLPKIREMVAQNGFLPQDAEQRDKSWLDTYGMVKTLMFRGAYGGKLLIDGAEAAKTPIAGLCQKVGLVFQNPFNQLSGAKDTVFEEIAFGLQNLGIPREEIFKRVEENLKLLDIEEYKDRNPFDLSGGQTQRVAIASILAMSR